MKRKTVFGDHEIPQYQLEDLKKHTYYLLMSAYPSKKKGIRIENNEQRDTNQH